MPVLANSTQSSVVETNKELSAKIDELAQEIDSLLSNRRGKPKNETTLRLIGFANSQENEDLVTSGHISVDLRLPKFEKKWKVRFSSFDDEDEFEGNMRNRDGAAPRKNKYGTSIGFIRKIRTVKTTFRPRLELKDPLVTSFLLKFEQAVPVKNYFLVKWQNKYFTHSIDGVGTSITLDFDKQILSNVIFRIFNESQYLDKENLFRVAQGLSLRLKLGDKYALSNSFSLNSANREIKSEVLVNQPYAESYHLNSYQYMFSFSHKLLRRVFHYQVSPYLDFSKRYSFKGKAGIRLRAEIIF